MVESRQQERRMPTHAGVAGHEVLDGRPLGVADVQRAGHVRRRLDDRERGQLRVGGRARGRRARRRRQPASARRSRLPPRTGRTSSTARSSFGPWKHEGPLVQRTNGSWYHLLVRCRRRVAHRDRLGSNTLVTRYRASTARLASDLHTGGVRAARTIPHSLRTPFRATPLGRRREGGSVARAPRPTRPRGPPVRRSRPARRASPRSSSRRRRCRRRSSSAAAGAGRRGSSPR